MSGLERRKPLTRKTALSGGKPLAPGKPLARATPLARTTPLARAAPLARATPTDEKAATPRKPLTRATPLQRAAPLPRTAPDAARADAARTAAAPPRTRRPADTGATARQRAIVFDRDEGRCARCGIDLTTGATPYNDHHRQGRGMGGRQGDARAAANLPSRRVTLCGSGTTGCHGHVTSGDVAGAERDGLVVRRGGGIDPARVPVRTWRGWVLLDDDGGTRPCPAPPDGDARLLAAV